MKKQKYYYNSSTLTYERAKNDWRKRLVKVFAYFSSVFVLAIVLAILFFNFFETPQERIANQELQEMEDQFLSLQARMESMDDVLNNLAKRDENIYRVIFESEPISDEVRKSGFGGGNRYEEFLHLPSGKMIQNLQKKADQLEKQASIQVLSYQETILLIQNKEEMLASVPAIIPIPLSERVRISSGFKMRLHPIYRTWRMHEGIDITAPTGTAIYVSGNGVVEKVESRKTGYGKYIVVNHGFGYKTLYAHMSKFDVSVGQKVTRGQKIGEVGNTGTSTGPHLHYEVQKNGNKINPIHFFFSDLLPQEYEEIIERAEFSSQSFD